MIFNVLFNLIPLNILFHFIFLKGDTHGKPPPSVRTRHLTDTGRYSFRSHLIPRAHLGRCHSSLTLPSCHSYYTYILFITLVQDVYYNGVYKACGDKYEWDSEISHNKMEFDFESYIKISSIDLVEWIDMITD